MITKEQTFEVVLFTTDEEIDGENLIDEAIRIYAAKHRKTHINNVSVNAMRSEWDESRQEEADEKRYAKGWDKAEGSED